MSLKYLQWYTNDSLLNMWNAVWYFWTTPHVPLILEVRLVLLRLQQGSEPDKNVFLRAKSFVPRSMGISSVAGSRTDPLDASTGKVEALGTCTASRNFTDNREVTPWGAL